MLQQGAIWEQLHDPAVIQSLEGPSVPAGGFDISSQGIAAFLGHSGLLP